MNGPVRRLSPTLVGSRLVQSTRRATAPERSEAADATLGIVLAFVAGGVNAGGFIAVGRYTSHMSGITSAMADDLAVGAFGLALAGLGSVLTFVAGAALSAILINFGRRQGRSSVYAVPILVEAGLILLFGLIGFAFASAANTAVAVALLCFVMGLQNATVTKISGARIRTTHVTGIVTDIGIELGKLVYRNRAPDLPPVRADRAKLLLLIELLAGFFVGGVAGGLAFSRFGFAASLPFAVLLLALAGPRLASSRPAP